MVNLLPPQSPPSQTLIVLCFIVWFQCHRKENFHDESLPPDKSNGRSESLNKTGYVCFSSFIVLVSNFRNHDISTKSTVNRPKSDRLHPQPSLVRDIHRLFETSGHQNPDINLGKHYWWWAYIPRRLSWLRRRMCSLWSRNLNGLETGLLWNRNSIVLGGLCSFPSKWTWKFLQESKGYRSVVFIWLGRWKNWKARPASYTVFSSEQVTPKCVHTYVILG